MPVGMEISGETSAAFRKLDVQRGASAGCGQVSTWTLGPPSGTLARVGFTAKQLEQMQQRLARPKRAGGPVVESAMEPAAKSARTILGIDPSLRGTGYGVIVAGKPQVRALAFGTIVCPPKWEHSRCLLKIAETLRDVLQEHKPETCVVEGLFYAQNFQTALIMGAARGAALVAVAEAGLPVFEMAPRKVKQAIVGHGAAQKIAVAKMVQRMLGLAELPDPDAADALAIALAYAQETGRYSLNSPRKV